MKRYTVIPDDCGHLVPAENTHGMFVLHSDVEPRLALMREMVGLLKIPPWDRYIEWEKKRLDILTCYEEMKEKK
jgi:hypothetical protein